MTPSSNMLTRHKLLSFVRSLIASTISLPFLTILLNSSSFAAPVSFGYIPASPEVFSEQPEVPRYRAFLPAKVDLSRFFPPPGFQKEMNSCTGWAVGYAARGYYALRQEGRDIKQLSNVPNPNYIYQSIRLPNNCASGALLLDAFRLLQKGSLAYNQYPIDTCARPSASQRLQASNFKIRDWLAVRPQHTDDVKGQIAKGNPVIIGIEVMKSLETLGAKDVYRGIGERVGFHALTVVGYDDQRQAFKVINSWSADWANGGFGWIDYSIVRRDVSEAYIIRLDSKPVETVEEVESPEVEPPKVKDNTVIVVSPSIVVKPKPKPEQTKEFDTSEVIERPVVSSDCSDIRWESVGSRVQVTGYAPTKDDIELIERYNRGRPIDIRIDLRPWPQCEFLKTLAPLLNKPDTPKLATKSGKSRFSKGDSVIFELTAPKKPTYLYVSYVQTDGEVITLHQPSSDLSPAKSEEKFVFGDGANGLARYRVTEPFGRETIVVLASDSPLFEDKLPNQMSEREYLSELRKAVLYKSDTAESARNVSAAFLGLETTE